MLWSNHDQVPPRNFEQNTLQWELQREREIHPWKYGDFSPTKSTGNLHGMHTALHGRHEMLSEAFESALCSISFVLVLFSTTVQSKDFRFEGVFSILNKMEWGDYCEGMPSMAVPIATMTCLYGRFLAFRHQQQFLYLV